jgi:hypothetical protein
LRCRPEGRRPGACPAAPPRALIDAGDAGWGSPRILLALRHPRWHALICDEARLTLPQAQLALAALHGLASPAPVGDGQALVAV